MNLKIILGFCFLVLIISGCTTSQYVTSSMRDFRVGTKGISMTFLPESKDIQVLQDDEFVTNIQLKNEGAHNIASLYFLLGIEEDYVQVLKKKFNSKELKNSDLSSEKFIFRGKSPELPGGQVGLLEAELKAKKIILSKFQETMLSGIVCYDYSTIVESDVCIQPYGNMIGLQPACTPKDIILNSQGGPLAVTKIEIKNNKISDNKIKSLFKIYIEHKGKGDVIQWFTAEKICSTETLDDNKIWNYFLVKAFLGGKEIKCRAVSYDWFDNSYYLLRLKDKKAEILCEAINPIGMAYETPLRIELNYDYTETVTKKLIIEKI